MRAHLVVLPAFAAWALLLSGCAYVGDTLPPSLKIPVRITTLHAIERGDRLVVDFDAPDVTTDGAVLKKLLGCDLRAGPAGPGWEAGSRRIDTAVTAPGPVHVEAPVDGWVGQEIAIRARTAARRGRFSEWSEPVVLRIVPPLEPPHVTAEAAPAGVRLFWSAAPSAEYRVYRAAEGGQSALIATVKTPEFLDAQAQFGRRYEYTVQSFVASGTSEAQSRPSGVVAITPVDRFPPATPSSLSATAGVSTIELSWTPDTEADLMGYYVYRALGDAPLVRLGGLLDTPAYTDRAVESGKEYRYAVSAIDQSGNESPQSSPVKVSAP